MLQYAPAAYNFVQKLKNLAIDMPSLNVTRYADEVPDYGPLSISRTYNIQNKPFQETLGFTTKPFRNPDFYETPEDVYKAFATGLLQQGEAAGLLRSKFGVRGVGAPIAMTDKIAAQPKFKTELASFLEANPDFKKAYSNLYNEKIQQAYIAKQGGKYFDPKQIAFVQRALNLAMDPKYLANYPNMTPKFKLINAMKDSYNPDLRINDFLSSDSYRSNLELARRIIQKEGLDYNIPVGKVEKFDERAIFVNDGRTVIPMSDSAAAKTLTISGKPKKMPVRDYLAELPVGAEVATPYINQVRVGIKGKQGLSFTEIKTEAMKNPKIKNYLSQIKRVAPNDEQLFALDHVRPQRFGGTNDKSNLRYIMESSHRTLRKIPEEDLPQGAIVRENVGSKTVMETLVFNRNKKIVDLLDANYLQQNKISSKKAMEMIEQLSDEVFSITQDFKKANPGVDFATGHAHVLMQTKNGPQYVPYYMTKNLNADQMKILDTAVINIENRPNQGQSIEKSFEALYERYAPFIMEGADLKAGDIRKLSEETAGRARGGVVGLNDGGEPATEKKSFFEKYQDQVDEQIKLNDEAGSYILNKLKPVGEFLVNAMSKTTAGVPPSLAFVDKEEVTPEDTIAAGALLQLQPLDDKIDEIRNSYAADVVNNSANLSNEAQQYLLSKNAVDDLKAKSKKRITLASRCSFGSADQDECELHFPRSEYPDYTDLATLVQDQEEFYFDSDEFKKQYPSFTGFGPFNEQVTNVKNELLQNKIRKLPLDTANALVEIYQALAPISYLGGSIEQRGIEAKGDSLVRSEYLDMMKGYTESMGMEFTPDMEEYYLSVFDDLERTDMPPSLPLMGGNVEDKFNRRVFTPAGGDSGQPLSLKGLAKTTGMSVLALMPIVGNPSYAGRILEVMKRDDIGVFKKMIYTQPRLLGMPTKDDLFGMFRLLKKSYTGTNQAIANSPTAQNVIKNIDSILAMELTEQQVERKNKEEAEVEKNITNYYMSIGKGETPEFQKELAILTRNNLETMLANPSDFLGTEQKVSELLILSNTLDQNAFENVPRWVEELAKRQALAIIKENNLKRSTLGDMLFYDMRNPKPEEPKVDIFEEEVLPNVIPKLSTGGDPLQEMQSVMLGGTDERNEQVDQLDIFQEPRNTELPAEVEMANLVFGKAPGWAIAGVNKIDDLLRPGGTGQRIAQADVLADQATTVGEKANRFFSGLEARLIDPNSPEVFNGPEDLYNFLQSKGISKFEVEDYQIPQLIETMTKTGQPITKAGLLERIKNAPIRKLKSTVRGFRSETENINGTFDRAKYGDSYYEPGSIPESYRENILYLEAGDIPGDVALYRHSTHGFFPDDSTNYVIGWTRGTDRYAIIPGTKGQVTNIGPKTDELNNKIERLTKITNRSPEDIVNQSGGRVSLEQATTNINKAKKQLAQAQEDLANVGKTDDAIVTGDQTVRVTFADEIQSDIMQTYRKHLENVMNDYKELVDKGIDVRDTQKIRQEGYRMNLKTDQDVLEFYAKHKTLFRPVFKTEEDFAAYIDDIRKSQAVFKDFAKIRPGTMTPAALAAVRQAGKERDKVLTMFEEAFTNPETLKKLFPNIPFKDRKVWGDALIKNDLAMAAKRKFVDKDANAADWYVISPAELITNRYGQKGTTATPFAERTRDMKGIGQYEFYGGPNVTDPNGKHYTGILEQSLRRAAKVNNAEFKIVKVQVGDAKSVSRSVQIVNAQGDIVKEFKMAKSSKAEDFGEVMNKAEDYINESGAEGLMARPVEIPSGFKTIDAYAIKLTPEMVLPTKTHLASGGYVRYDPLVSIDEMIGAA
jgi:hypothetical protein